MIRPKGILLFLLAVWAANTSGAEPPVSSTLPAVYELPAPGSYELPVIDRIEDHVVLDAEGRSRNLFALKAGRLALIAFVYTGCAEAEGCPLATAVMRRLDHQLASEPALAHRVRLLSLSFDPARDTPSRMADLEHAQTPRTDWAFLTTSNEKTLEPILADFGQQIGKLTWEDGAWSGLFRHVLKVFLLDEQNRVRNIYGSGFLDAALVLTDVRTLVAETSEGVEGRRD